MIIPMADLSRKKLPQPQALSCYLLLAHMCISRKLDSELSRGLNLGTLKRDAGGSPCFHLLHQRPPSSLPCPVLAGTPILAGTSQAVPSMALLPLCSGVSYLLSMQN